MAVKRDLNQEDNNYERKIEKKTNSLGNVLSALPPP